MKTIAAIALLLSGCTVGPDWRLAGPGGASYEYTRTLADGTTCTVSLVSGRDIMGGNLHIGPNCELDSKADSTMGAVKSLEVINNGIQLSRELASKVP